MEANADLLGVFFSCRSPDKNKQLGAFSLDTESKLSWSHGEYLVILLCYSVAPRQ